ncbi:shikimate kinase [Thermocladium modestius]|uniref:Shikimate kinase n=1 Tax=Thermocladium modestius TaxID=62609 RepID=A0A830GV77_9CREN|nr:shikimate kinase [Thermocladium modestius]GGP18904.1 shikimate kinase [Thermocladium modestius]
MARAYGGVSIVNAVPAGVGSVMAVDLAVDVRAWECPRSEARSMDDEYVLALAEEARKALGLGPLCVEVRSSIPPGSGLKSNSAVATALMLEASRLAGNRWGRLEAAVAAARATLALGRSITGALDDATAAALGGITFTDNLSMRLVRRDEAPSVAVVIYVPRIPKRVDVNRLRLLRAYHESLFELAMRGMYWTAMLMNGLAIDAALGYGLAPIAWAALSMGAVAAGITGNGPALAAVFRDSPREYLNWLGEFDGSAMLVRPVNEVG